MKLSGIVGCSNLRQIPNKWFFFCRGKDVPLRKLSILLWSPWNGSFKMPEGSDSQNVPEHVPVCVFIFFFT